MSTADSVAMSGLVIEVEYQVSVRRVQIRSIGDEVEAGSHHLPCWFQLGRCVAGNFETYVAVAVAPPRVGAVRGDTFVTVQCTPVSVRLRVATTCYEDAPVYQQHEEEQLFVDVHSRRLKPSSAVTPCSQLGPMLVNRDHR